jgi:hypothetical protein
MLLNAVDLPHEVLERADEQERAVVDPFASLVSGRGVEASRLSVLMAVGAFQLGRSIR